MTRDELLAALRSLAFIDDFEMAHVQADDALLDFIGDAEVTAAFGAIKKQYA